MSNPRWAIARSALRAMLSADPLPVLGFLDRAFAPTARSVSAAGGLGDLEILVGDLNGRGHGNDFGDHGAGSSIQ